MFGHQNYPRCERGSNLGPLAPEASALTSGYFCRSLLTFANSLDPDRARQNVRPDLDPERMFQKKLIFKKITILYLNSLTTSRALFIW